MSENKHTPEPWPVFSDIATTLTPDPEGAPAAILSWDDYIRARACVNACPGIETQDLEVLRRNGHVTDGDIKIDGGDQRDITIHPPKAPRNERAAR